ncbi:hypothetical protein OQA88_8102 [Cercophora sp. LCS_1]
MSTTASGLPPAPTDGLLPSNGTFGNETAPPILPFPDYVEITPWAAYLARVFWGLNSALLFLCVVTYTLRMYQRIRPVWKVGADDWFITLGFLLAITDFGLMGPQQIPVASRISIDYSVHTVKHSWIGIGVWGLAMTCIKVSIALTLLRIQGKSLAWRIFLYAIMFVCTAYGILNLFFNLVIACRPLAAAWDFRIIEKQCVSIEIQRLASNIGSGVNISTDILLSLSPAVFLRKLNRPLRERLFICFLMSLGLLATVSSILKTVIIQKWGDPTLFDDFWAQGVAISTYTMLEQFCGVLAACVPALKSILQAGLNKMGVSLTESRSRPGRSGYFLNDRSANGTGGMGSGNRTAATTQYGSRYARSGKDDPMEDDEEKCLEMPEIRRGAATPTKSTRTNSGSFREADFKSGVVVTAHAV